MSSIYVIIASVIAGAVLVGVSIAIAHRMGKRAAVKAYNRQLEEVGVDLSDGGIFGNIDQALREDDEQERKRKAWERHLMWNRILPWRWVKFSIARVNQSQLEANSAREELHKAWSEKWELQRQLKAVRTENQKLRGEPPRAMHRSGFADDTRE